MRGLNIGPAGEPITNITISMDVGPNDRIITPINSDFIGTDIARAADVPTKTSQLTNDSGFVTSTELAAKQDKLDSYSDSASVANDKLTINYKVKQEDGTYSDVPVEFSGGSKYTFTDGLTETNGTVSLGGKLSTDNGAILKPNSSYGNFITFDNNQSGSSHHYISVNNQSTLGFSLSIDGYSKGIKILTSKDSKIYSTLPIIPSGFNEQDINIDLGNNAHK